MTGLIAAPAVALEYRAVVINPDFQQAARNPATGTLVLVGSDLSVWRRGVEDRDWQPARLRGPLPALDLQRVAFAAGIGVALGQDGLLLRSDDDGRQWQRVDAPAAGSLRDLLVLADGSWLVAGGGGRLLRSDDAGVHWTVHAVGLDLQLNRLYQAEDQRVWVAGEAGLLAVSDDAGRTWQVRHHVAGSPPLRSLAGAAGVLLAGGGQGWLLRSDDGGRRWASGATPSTAFIDGLHWVPRWKRWVALTHQGERLWSGDGGRRWQAAGAALGTALSALWQEPGSGRLVAVGHAGIVQQSSDGGRHWRTQRLGHPRDLLGVLADRQGLTAWGRQGLLLQTDAGASRWQVLREALSHETTTLAALPDGRTVLAAGIAGWMARSVDGGVNWQPVPMKFVVDLYPTDFRALRVLGDGRSLLAAGPTASVMRSVDGGQRWTSVMHRPFETAETPVDLVAAADGSWVVPEMSGPIDSSRDDGRTWTRQAAPQPWPDGAITRTGRSSAHDGTLLLVGRGPQLLRSTDHGRHWQAVPLPGSFNLFALWADAQSPRWWLAGAEGALLRSDDAGLTWRLQTIESSPPVGSVLLNLSRPTGGPWVVAGRDGVLATSSDGERWDRQQSGTNQDLRVALLEPGSGRLVLVGRGGTVLRCEDPGCRQVQALDSRTRSDFRAALFLPDGSLLAAGPRIVRLVPQMAD